MESYARRLDCSDDPAGEIDPLAFELVALPSLRPNDLVLYVPGDRIGVSGVVVEGRARLAGGATDPRAMGVARPGSRVPPNACLLDGYVIVRVVP